MVYEIKLTPLTYRNHSLIALNRCATGSAAKMVKRKSKRQPLRRPKALKPLQTDFDCPFCNHEKSCEVVMNKALRTATITCRKCLEDFVTAISYLTEPIDVYSEWIDAYEAVNG